MNVNIDQFLQDLPQLDSNSNYWLFRANSGSFYTDFNINSYVGIGWNNISLSDIKNSNNTPEILKQKIIQKNPKILKDSSDNYSSSEDLEDTTSILEQKGTEQLSQRQLSSLAGQLLRFVNDVNLNDLVVVPSVRSQQFIVGRVIGTPYEATDTELEIQNNDSDNYEHSGYKKRINISWLGRFNRNDADATLYKMIYSQHTLSDINKYSSFINRALFDAYVLDDSELHLTYHITKETDIDAKLLGQFIYQYSELYELTGSGNDLQIKVNVQSPGPAEITAKRLFGGALVFLILSGIGITEYGGGKINVEFGEQKINLDIKGLSQTMIDNKKQNEDLQHKKNDNILLDDQEAYQTAKKLQVPISSLGIELPKKAQDALQKQLNNDPNYKLNRSTKKANPQKD